MTDNASHPDFFWADLLAQMVESTPIPTFVIDKNHVVTHFNKACERLTGIKAHSIVGTRNHWKAFYAEQRPVMADVILDTLEAELSECLEKHYPGKYRMSAVKTGAIEAEDFFPALGDDGRWLFFTAAPLKNSLGDIIGAMETLQDITREKKAHALTVSMLKISRALQKFSYLEDLLDFIGSEIRELLSTEGALVVLYDREKEELYLPGIAYDDPDQERRLRDLRFSLDEVVAGQVIRTGQAVIQNEIDPKGLALERDRKLGYRTRNLVEVPVIAEDRIIGVLCAINRKEGRFTDSDVERLSTLAGTVALAIENLRYAEDLRKAYRDVRSLNTAKDKAINHLSHELKTPLTVLAEVLNLLEEELSPVPEENWKSLTDMARRHMKRLMDIQEEVADIIGEKDEKTQAIMGLLLDQCADHLAVLAAREWGKGEVVGRLKQHIEGLFRPRDIHGEDLDPADFVEERLETLKSGFAHRPLRIETCLERTRTIHMPREILAKIIDGLIRNAVENTPDHGLIHLSVREEGSCVNITVRDHGTGIAEDKQARIFEGFYPTQSQTAYSTRKPFDFNAGGKGADLLRMKIFSETYGFSLAMSSTPCVHCHGANPPCPGDTGRCPAVQGGLSCDESGGTGFVLSLNS